MAIEQQEDETWTATCERIGCGGFESSGHQTKKAATERLAEHHDEHEAAERQED